MRRPTRPATPTGKPLVRCAAYTRKSSEEGLDQSFNSLDAQRDAAEAYIKSQASEGWVCLSQDYSDGGFTGGNMERPGLRQLLADIDAGKIDAVVVYKVDRLSRSLIDFAKMMELFERRNISFVSVTQRFSTADSMGRLTLNMLLSFAQFEREIISERTRDKIAASRRRGKWSGGRPILGYDLQRDGYDNRLVVNESEAKRVREIFGLYLKHEAMVPVVAELDQRGWRTKCWTTRKGKLMGDKPFTKHLLYLLLNNVAYIGRVKHKTETYPGEHSAIVDPDLFERVQAVMKRNGTDGGTIVRNRYHALLKGILKCGSCGCSMGFTYSSSRRVGGIRYQYYVCQSAQKRGWANCSVKSVQASLIEEFIVKQVRQHAESRGELPHFDRAWSAAKPAERPALLRQLVYSADYDGTAQRIKLAFRPTADPTGHSTPTIATASTSRRGSARSRP